MTSILNIQRAVAAHYGVTVEDIRSLNRKQPLATHRQVAMFLSCRLTFQSLPMIARAFKRDHTTVSHGIGSIRRRMMTDRQLAEDIEALCARIGERAVA